MQHLRTQRTWIVPRRLIALGLSLLMLGAVTPWCCLVESGHHHSAAPPAVTGSGAQRAAGRADSHTVDTPTFAECPFGHFAPQARAGDNTAFSFSALRWMSGPEASRMIIFGRSERHPAPAVTSGLRPSPSLALETPPPRAG